MHGTVSLNGGSSPPSFRLQHYAGPLQACFVDSRQMLLSNRRFRESMHSSQHAGIGDAAVHSNNDFSKYSLPHIMKIKKAWPPLLTLSTSLTQLAC